MKLRPSRVQMLSLSPRPLPNIRRRDYQRRLALEALVIWAAVGGLVWYLLSH